MNKLLILSVFLYTTIVTCSEKSLYKEDIKDLSAYQKHLIAAEKLRISDFIRVYISQKNIILRLEKTNQNNPQVIIPSEQEAIIDSLFSLPTDQRTKKINTKTDEYWWHCLINALKSQQKRLERLEDITNNSNI